MLIIERSVFGGQIISTPEIENYPGLISPKGQTFAADLFRQIESLDVEKASDEILSAAYEDELFTVCGKISVYTGRSLIIAVGTKNRKLGLPGEESFTGRGISYCATCDGAFYLSLIRISSSFQSSTSTSRASAGHSLAHMLQ